MGGVDEWMDGVDGWVSGRMDGRVGGWVEVGLMEPEGSSTMMSN